MADRVVTPSDQRHFIEPFDQRVFQFGTSSSDVFLSRVANSIYKIFGDDIVMYGLEINALTFDSTHIHVTINPGALIQDNTLLICPSETQLSLPLNGLDSAGKVVIVSRYGYLETFEQNQQQLLLNYVDQTEAPVHDFIAAKDRVVLGIFDFAKDESDNVISVTESTTKTIIINSKEYTVRGYTDENKRITSYLLHQLFSDDDTSLTLDPERGMMLEGDVGTPGNMKFYGTNGQGVKGFYDLSSLGVDNESDQMDYQKQYNQVLYNGNLYFVEDGHSVVELFS